MVLKLFGLISCPAVRAVLLCAKALNIEIEYVTLDINEKEHLKPEYLKVNPQHTVPMIDDDGFILVDSHAIMPYLVSKYGKDDSLYPNDLQERAIVNHRLHFDSSILFSRGLVIIRSIINDHETNIPKKLLLALEEAINISEKFLENNIFVAGNQVTIADFSFITSITSLALFVPVTEIRYPKISAWIKRMQALPYYHDGNQIGLERYMTILKQKMAK